MREKGGFHQAYKNHGKLKPNPLRDLFPAFRSSTKVGTPISLPLVLSKQKMKLFSKRLKFSGKKIYLPGERNRISIFRWFSIASASHGNLIRFSHFSLVYRLFLSPPPKRESEGHLSKSKMDGIWQFPLGKYVLLGGLAHPGGSGPVGGGRRGGMGGWGRGFGGGFCF